MDKRKEPSDLESQEEADSSGNERDDNIESLDEARKAREKREGGEREESEIPVVDKRFWTKEGARLQKGKKRKEFPTYVEELKHQLKEKEEKLQAYAERFASLKEETKKFRERKEKEVERQIDNIAGEILHRLLPILDDLDRAVASSDEGKEEDLRAGVALIRDQFLEKLEGLGVTRMEVEGQEFDPSDHEAVDTLDVERPEDENKVIRTIQAGYRFHDRLLRAARVLVGKFAETTEEEDAS